MHTKHDFYKDYSLPVLNASYHFRRPLPEVERLEFPIDETALSANKATIEQLEQDREQLRFLENRLTKEVQQASDAAQKARVSFELGETSADAVQKAQQQHTKLRSELDKLRSQTQEVSGQIEIKNAAIEVLKQRRAEALEIKRQHVFQEISSEISSDLATLLRLYRDANEIESRIAGRLRQLSLAKLTERGSPQILLNHEAIAKYLFYGFERELYYAKHNPDSAAPTTDQPAQTHEAKTLFEETA